MPASTALKATKSRVRQIGDEPRERGLAGARRAPEDDRLQQVALDRFAQRTARADQLVLAFDFVERARPHALGERHRAGIGWEVGSSKSDAMAQGRV